MASKSRFSRRSFIRGGALSAAVLSRTGGETASAAPRFKRRSPASNDLIKVGLLTTAGHIKTIWGPLINPIKPKARYTGMVMTHGWDNNAENLDYFCKTYDAEKVDRYDGMIGKVDAVIMPAFNTLHWNQDLVRPYLEAGVPTFINRPVRIESEKRSRYDRDSEKTQHPYHVRFLARIRSGGGLGEK